MRTFSLRPPPRRTLLATACAACALAVLPACSDPADPVAMERGWRWRYAAPGIDAQGVFVTTDTVDVDGYYRIKRITGERNGVVIVGMHPTGSAIPGNEPYLLENRIADTGALITKAGFGFALADGRYASAYYADFLSPRVHVEVFSTPPFAPGAVNFGPEDSELPIDFSAFITERRPAVD
jgi:hypothetical protein